MNTTNQSNMEDGATPSMLWCNIAEYIGMLSKSMMKTYRQRSRGNHQITWGELDKVNKDLHDQLDIIIAGNRNVQTISENNNKTNENRNMKQTIRLTESDLQNIIKEAINELDWKTYASAADKSVYNKDFDRAYKFADAARDRFNDKFEKYDKPDQKSSFFSSYRMNDYLPHQYDSYDNGKEWDRFGYWLQSYRPYEYNAYLDGKLDDNYINRLYKEFLNNVGAETELIGSLTDRFGDDWDGFRKNVKYGFGDYRPDQSSYDDKGTWPEEAEPTDDTFAAKDRGNKEVRDYKNGKYEYKKGKGWVKKGENLDESITRAIRKLLR